MSKKKLFLIALSSGVLLSLSWVNVMMFAPLILVAFVPLLFVEDYISENNNDKKFSSYATFRYTFLPFLLFTFTTTYWIAYASAIGLVAPLFEATFMAIVFQIYHYTKKASKENQGRYFFILFYWLLFEFVQYRWDLNFPWLNLGNTFASYPILIQWYCVLGMEGGTLWILLCNIMVYLVIKKYLCFDEKKQRLIFKKQSFCEKKQRLFKTKQEDVLALLVIFIPIVCSILMWYGYKDEQTKEKVSVVVVQPNLDPYEEQYSIPPKEVVDRIENLTLPLMDDSVDYIVCPESCIQEYAWEDELAYVPSIKALRRFANNYKKAEVIAGMSSQRILPKGVKTEAARKLEDRSDQYFESCNISVDISRDSINPQFQIHHKSVLTAGVEKMPFKKYLPFIENLALNLGGTIGSLGIDTSPIVFYNPEKDITVATPICYESTDENYVRDFVNKGANMLFVITNDGWWHDTPGYKHHFAFSRIRAIENRRYIARSANTGTSGFISPRGEILMKTPYWQQKAIKMSLPKLSNKTFFTKTGDIISPSFSLVAILLFISTIIRNHISKKQKN